MAESSANPDPYAGLAVADDDPYAGVAVEDTPTTVTDPYAAAGAVPDDTPGALVGQFNTARRAGLGVLQAADAARAFTGAATAAQNISGLERLETEGRTNFTDLERLLEEGAAEIRRDNPAATEQDIEAWKQRRRASLRTTLEQRVGAGQQSAREAIGRIAERQTRIEAIPESADVQAYQDAQGFGEKLGVVLHNPVELPTNIAVRGAVSSVPSIALGAIGSLAGPGGAALGVGAGSALVEASSAVLDVLGQAGVDVRDQAAVEAALQDPAVLDAIRSRATTRAIPVAAFDALSAGLAGRLVQGARAAGRSVIGAGAAEVGAQMLAGGGGEAAAQLATEGEISDPTAIFEEAVGELVPGAGEIAQNVIHERVQQAQPAAVAQIQEAAVQVVGAQAAQQEATRAEVTPVAEVLELAETEGPLEEVYEAQGALAQASRDAQAARTEAALREQQAIALLEQSVAQAQELEAVAEATAVQQPTTEELSRAEGTGNEFAPTGEQAPELVEGAEGQVRLRDDAQTGLGAVPPIQDAQPGQAPGQPQEVGAAPTIEPLGRRYLVAEGIGEPVEQFQVRYPGDERGVTLTADQMRERGIPIPATGIAAAIETIDRANMDEFRALGTGVQGGLTGYAYQLGLSAQTTEEVQGLQDRAREYARVAREMMLSGNVTDEALLLSTKAQILREAYEAATGTGSAGQFLRESNPNYVPPFPPAPAPAPAVAPAPAAAAAVEAPPAAIVELPEPAAPEIVPVPEPAPVTSEQVPAVATEQPRVVTDRTGRTRIERPKAKPAAKQKGVPRGRGFVGLSKRPDNQYDILDAIADEGGVQGPRHARQVGGEYDDFYEAFRGEAKILIRKGGLRVDDLVNAVRDRGFPNVRDFGELYQAVGQAVRERIAVREQAQEETRRQDFMQSIDPEQPAPTKQKSDIVPISELVLGDQFTVRKTPVEVVNIDEQTLAPVVRDGDRFPGEFALDIPEIRIDSGSLNPNTAGREAAASFFEGGTIEQLPDEIRPSTDPRTGQIELLPTSTGFALTSEQQADPHAALERKLAQKELESANLLIPGSEKASFAPTFSDKLIKTLESAKIHKEGELFAATPLSLAWDAAIETAIVAIKAGRTLAQVIETAVQKLREQFPDVTPDNVAALESTIRESFLPAAGVPGSNPADTSAADLEAAEAEFLAIPETGPEAEDIRQEKQRVKTRVFGEKFTVIDRRRLTADERAAAQQRAQDAFDRAGLPVTWDATNEVYRLTDPNTPAETEGRSLVEILKAELARGEQRDTGLLSVLVNSIRNPDGGLWKNAAFSPGTRLELFSLAQGEASFRGLALAALHAAKRSLSFVAQNVETVLHKVYSDAFGGSLIGSILNRTRQTATERTAADIEAALSQTEQGRKLLEQLRNAEPTELDQFIGELLRQSQGGIRITDANVNIPARVAELFPLANWREILERTGGKQIEQSWWRLLAGPQPDDTGNVAAMDRSVQRELGGLLRQTLDRLGLIPDPAQPVPAIEKLALALGQGDLRREKIARADEAVRADIDERETAELNSAQAIEDEELRSEREAEIQEKYHQLRMAWDEATTAMTEQPASASMLRRLVHAETKAIFESTGLSWQRMLEPGAQRDALRRAVQTRIQNRLQAIIGRANAPVAAEEIAAVVEGVGNAFDQIITQKQAAREASAARRRGRVGEDVTPAQRTAEQELGRLAQTHSDVQSWTPQKTNVVRDAINEQKAEPVPDEQFVQKLMFLEVAPDTAQSLATAIRTEINARARRAELARGEQLASPRAERDAGAEPAASRPGVKPLIDAIIDAPASQQADPAWRRRQATEYMIANGLTPEQAQEAARLFEAEFAKLWTQTRRKALDTVRRSLTPRQRQDVARIKGLWKRIEEAVNAGVFDNTAVLEEIAKARGWTVPTPEQRARLKQLADREQALRQLTPEEIARIGPDLAAQNAARVDKEAATTDERMRLRREMQTLWSRFVRPITWRTPEGRRNLGAAMGEFLSANMLLKLGFLTKQPFDVMSQAVWHVPSRAFAAAADRANRDRSAGREVRYWSDVGNSLQDAATGMREAASQALVQFRQGLRGRGEIRSVEGLVPAISVFDRALQRAEELRGRPDARSQAERALLIASSWMRFALNYARAFDNINGTFAEAQETRQQLITELRENGLTPEQARAQAEDILGDWNAERQLATTRAKEWLDSLGVDYTRTQLAAAAYEVYKARQYTRMKSATLDADEIRDSNEFLRQTVGWNQPETGGVGGVIAAGGRAAARFTENLGLALPVARFANAIAIGTNRALTWTPVGFFPSAFGRTDPATGVHENAWFRTPKDRIQRKYEAAIGSMLGGMIISAALAGLIRVWDRPPPDKEDRELWEKQGHRSGTVEIQVGPNEFVPVSLSSGPLAYLRTYLSGVAWAQDALDNHAKSRRRLEARAQRDGLAVPPDEGMSAGQIAAAVAWGAYQGAAGGRTAGGALRSFTGSDTGEFELKKFGASQVGPFIPGLPAYQEMQRALSTRIDQRNADFIDFLVPTAGSLNAQRNFLGDEITRDRTQQIIQTLTGGTYPGIVDTKAMEEMKPYRILARIPWRPAPLSRTRGYEIDGVLRPLTDEEYVRVFRLRGAYLKRGLEALDESLSDEDLELDARDVGSDALQDALRDGAGAVTPFLDETPAP